MGEGVGGGRDQTEERGCSGRARRKWGPVLGIMEGEYCMDGGGEDGRRRWH